MASIREQSAPIQITGTLDMRQNAVVGLETDLNVYPISDDQGASKKYVDATRDYIVSVLPDTADNGEF